MTEEEVRAAVYRLFDLWNGGDLTAIEQLYDPGFTADYQPYSWREGLDGIRAMVSQARTATPDYHEELLDLVVDGDRAAVRLRITFTHTSAIGPIAATGKRISYEELVLFTFRDGRVLSQRGIPDNLSMLRQMGVVPVPPGQAAARPDA
jgi:predicted ester cyclase